MKYVIYTEQQVQEAREYIASCYHHGGWIMMRELGEPVAEFSAPNKRSVKNMIRRWRAGR